MELSNNQHQTQPRSISTVVRIFCCIVFYACSAAIPLLLYYIGSEGVDPLIPTAIGFVTFALCTCFTLTLCRKPLFISCAIAGALLLALLSPFFSVIFLALLCATVAGAALLTDDKNPHYLTFGIAAVAAFGTAFVLTAHPLLSAEILLPALVALALALCQKRKCSIILSVGIATGTLLTAYLLLIGVEALLAGMQFSIQGVTEYVKTYHAAVAGLLEESIRMMVDPEVLAEKLALSLGNERSPEEIAKLAEAMAASTRARLGIDASPEAIAAFSSSVASAILGILPGIALMLTWLFSFIAHRGLTAVIVRGLDKKDYPAHLTAFAPSVPTAIFTLLCYAALMISSLITGGELAIFVSLNLLLAVMPLMTVCGILSIISNIKHAAVKWPLFVTYLLAVIFLGIAVIPMIAFFGSFAVITHALASALEKKLNNFKGGQ